ncbi:MAG: DHH family phosphoesterase [Coprococcus sp.]|nr:DHH family phosphoesterase [Coprococcus sp.]
MKQNVKLKGQLRLYMQWPAIMILLLAAMDIWIFKTNRKAGMLMFAFILVYAAVVGIMYFSNKSLLFADLVEFAAQYGIVQNTLLKELSVPYAILLDDGKIVWANTQFREVLGEDTIRDAHLNKYIPEMNQSVFPKEEDATVSLEFRYNERDYQAEIRCVSVDGLNETEQLMEMPTEKNYFIAIHLQDVTELNECLRENEKQRLVAGLIYIDNYDEVMDSVEEVRQSLLVALIDRKINQYIANTNGIAKKLEKDKYFVIIKKESFEEMEADRFSLLEDVKSVNIGNQVPVTLSFGVGLSRDTYLIGYNYARVAIDLALARGGDQVVVKNGQEISYYGGKREQTSKNTRVKARVKAEALREFITAKEQIIVMGHKMTDVDSFGAAIGIYRAAAALEKKVHIVLNDISVTLRPLYESFRNNPAYPEDLFVDSREAEELADEGTMVIVVDTNKPKMTECERLLKLTKTIAVLDHHRQSDEVIENAVLSYIEPYASSACEMVAEVLQYFSDDLKLTPTEANSMYAGVLVDTNNFVNRTGVRTFEAAAYLRRCGADITYVRKLLRDDMASYRAKAAIISSAEVYRDVYAIARGQHLGIESPTIIGAQAANELLDIEEIKASFVLTEYNGKIYVSARAIDEVNVQIIMERLGGGGHLNTAGAQFEHTDMERGIEDLKKTISMMIAEGAI